MINKKKESFLSKNLKISLQKLTIRKKYRNISKRTSKFQKNKNSEPSKKSAQLKKSV
jgi:hypothetical protein